MLFAITSMLSFTRLAYILPAHESLGTLQISIGKMIDDMIRCVCPALHAPVQGSSSWVGDSLAPHTRPCSGVILCFVLRSDPGGDQGTICSAGGRLQEIPRLSLTPAISATMKLQAQLWVSSIFLGRGDL